MKHEEIEKVASFILRFAEKEKWSDKDDVKQLAKGTLQLLEEEEELLSAVEYARPWIDEGLRLPKDGPIPYWVSRLDHAIARCKKEVP